jgi:aspartyl-tRNA(Asn)/glutamyl-tRNA(Gln) amidotransferase subunit C
MQKLYFCQMQIDDVLIDKLANLSRLQFTESEKSGLKSDFEKMLRFVDKLNELDTTGVEPMQHITGNINVLREDESAVVCSREEALANAPLKDEQFFKVPKVIKK